MGAKKAYEESKIKERELQEQLKQSQIEQRIKENDALRQHIEAEKAGAEARLDKQKYGKNAEKQLKVELTQLEKDKLKREKERAQLVREASGQAKGRGKGRGPLMLGDVASPAPNRQAVEPIQQIHDAVDE